MKILGPFIAALLCFVMQVCDSSPLNKGLEEEKSYTRHAMEYHRDHPNKRKGNRVLETWSTADYIAQAVERQKISNDWAEFSDRLPFLGPSIQNDVSGQPFCVIQKNSNVIVVDYFQSRPALCTLDAARAIDISRIQSGDMAFSGRTDNWVYRLRLESK
jgi:hypothetical protein